VWVAAAGLSGAVLLAIVFGHPPAGQGPTEKPRLLSTAPAATPPAPDMALNSVVAAATTLPASAPQAAEPPVAPGDTSALFEAPVANEAQAWQQLAKLWGWTLNSADPCAQAPAQGAACYTSTRGLGPIRLLNRPGWLTLHDEQGRSARPLLLGLNADHAWLQDARGRMHRVPLARLAWLWRGDFATLWRLPAGQPPVNPLPDTGPAADALAARLATLDGGPSTAADPARWHARILAFQLQQGLPADGEAGPMTLMRLNQLSGVREPTLASGKPSGAR
jgi:general secretion pathway protein A